MYMYISPSYKACKTDWHSPSSHSSQLWLPPKQLHTFLPPPFTSCCLGSLGILLSSLFSTQCCNTVLLCLAPHYVVQPSFIFDGWSHHYKTINFKNRYVVIVCFSDYYSSASMGKSFFPLYFYLPHEHKWFSFWCRATKKISSGCWKVKVRLPVSSQLTKVHHVLSFTRSSTA